MIGTRLGPYEIVAPLGAGNMGEVYRARDTKLGREVALKLLPATVAADPERLVRFNREAQVLASLNHPHIGAIYGLEDAGGSCALVLELVEGHTLAQRIARGALRAPEALFIARQIAEALDVAHQRGIIHRDLKPANIKIRADGMVKVLDFGLAKAFEPTHPDAAATVAATIGGQDTEPGMVLGTAAYMSPEQSRGKPVDKRTDIWAFGCVVYEMLTGRTPFGGETMSDVIVSVLEREPDWSALPASTPPSLDHLLRRCLAKDVVKRLRDIGDARAELEGEVGLASTAVALSRAPIVERLRWAGVIALAAAAAFFGSSALRRDLPDANEVRFETALPPDVPGNFVQLAISPNGRTLVVAPTLEGKGALWVRPMDSVNGRSLAGTDGAYLPFWSPDGRSIGFFAQQKLKRINLESETVEVICEVRVGRGGAWLHDGTIIFAPAVAGPLVRVAAAGGQPNPLTTLQQGQTDHRLPIVLPGETHLLYYARGSTQTRGVYVAGIDGSNPRRLLDADAPAVYSGTGHLLFVRQGELFAQRFEAGSLTLEGGAFRVSRSVMFNAGISLASMSASQNAIAYSLGNTGFRTQLAWFDRNGKRLDSLGTAENTPLSSPNLAPDGRSVAFSRMVGGNWDVWLLDMRAAMTRVTFAPGLDFFPVWSPDSKRLYFSSSDGPHAGIYIQRVNEPAAPDLVISGTAPTDVSADGRFLLYNSGSLTTQSDIMALPITDERSPFVVVRSSASERDAQFSPDGKWIAYQSNESGRDEIYLQPFPGPGQRVQVSAAGGEQVRWPRQGELMYVAGDRRMMAVPVKPTGSGGLVELGQPTALFSTPFDTSIYQQVRQQYSVSADGSRLLMNVPSEVREPVSIVVALHWKGSAIEP